jgi:GAF domain-containing protein
MLKEGELIGAFAPSRQEVCPFTDKQIELVQNFAAQAVIAIENARLLNELRERTTELSEALEQQTATSDVLQVISSSPGDLQPVFATMLENATRICDAKFGNVYLWDGDAFHLVATHNTPPAFAESRKRGPFRPGPTHPFSRLVVTKQILHVDDVAALPGYLERDPQIVEPVELGGIRTCLVIPMLKDANLIGALVVFRQEVRPFNDKQIALLTNFAAQAVIAIENARLLNELRESLEQQTATSEVLQVISSSPGALEPVFNTILESATRICEANFGILWLCEGGGFRCAALHNAPPAFAEQFRSQPVVHPPPGSVLTNTLKYLPTISIRSREFGCMLEDDANGIDDIVGPLSRKSRVITRSRNPNRLIARSAGRSRLSRHALPPRQNPREPAHCSTRSTPTP